MTKQPQLNGQKPEKLSISLVAFDLDRTDATHMALAERLERDDHVVLTVRASPDTTTWRVKKTSDGPILGVSFRVLIDDVLPAA